MAGSGQRKPDSGRWTELLAQNREQLIAIADRIVGDRDEAEDIVQETVTAVWQRSSQIEPNKLTNYLTRAVRRNALKRKTRRREFTASDDLETSEPMATRDAGLTDPIDLEEAIQQLPLAQQNVIRMKYYFGMTFRQIGAALSISTHTAASRCRYALVRLREIFQQ